MPVRLVWEVVEMKQRAPEPLTNVAVDGAPFGLSGLGFLLSGLGGEADEKR